MSDERGSPMNEVIEQIYASRTVTNGAVTFPLHSSVTRAEGRRHPA